MPLNTVKDMQLEEYQDLFKDFFIFNRKNGILEINLFFIYPYQIYYWYNTNQ